MDGGNDILMTVLIFILSLMFIGALAGAFLLNDSSDKRTRARLDRFRNRYGKADGMVRARSILLDQNTSSPLEAMLGRLVPRPETFRARLKKTGKNIPIGRYVAICGGVVIVSSLLYWQFFSLPLILSILLGIISGVGLPHIIVGKMIASRQKKFLSLFPEAIELIVRGLKSGLPINETIGIVGREVADPVGTEFARIADQVRFGKTLEDAMWQTANVLDFPDFKFFVISLAIQRETGGNLAETLGNLSNILRQRHQMKLKIKALSSEGKASAMIIGCLPFIMFGIIYAMNKSYASTFFTDPRAMIVLLGALVWMGIGGFIISKMISFEI